MYISSDINLYVFCLGNFEYRFADEPGIIRYVKIAATLRNKTVRDVALRCRWLAVSFHSFYDIFITFY